MLSYLKYYFNYQLVIKSVIVVLLLTGTERMSNIWASSFSSVTDGMVSVTEKAVQSLKDLGDESSDWEKYVRYFRKEHSISILSGYSSKRWSFSTKDASSEVSKIRGVEFSIRYSYDVSLYRRVGFFLGTLFFYKIPLSSDFLDCFNEFNLPGISGGLVLNLSPMFRMYLGSDLTVVRVTDLSRKDYPGVDIDISMVDLGTTFITDIFFSLKSGLRIEGSYGVYIDKLFYKDNFGDDIPRDYKIRTFKIKIGYVYHMM